MDNIVVRKPDAADVRGTFTDLATLRYAPPMVVALGALLALTGCDFIASGVGVVATTFAHAFWARLIGSQQ